LGASQQAFNATYTTAVQRFPRSSGSGSLEGTRGGKDLVLNSAPSPTPTATSTPSTGSLVEAISAGGLAVNQYRADPGFTQGIPWTGSPVSVDTSGVADPTPGAVYQSGRWGSNFTYTIGGLTAGGSYRLELQWAETYWPQAGQRVFNVAVGGTQVLSNFDVLANAGGFGKAIARSFALSADSNGQIVLSLSRGSADNPFLNGLELWQTAPGVALTGNQDIFGRAWNSAQMAAAEASGSTWSGGNWNGSTWSGSTWSGSTWSGSTWSGSTWSGSTWSGSTWSGSTWSGGTWSGGTWSGDLWATASWS
ncbi:MAG TPA: malectin domain-containing carbohydrate-binding protein, partial [Candidatus Dormibacteraeota bacterium]|nr:malectin domain-containing carbohydrate-binding protein [Candidatus Dormibacteraeota bacterium]